MRSSYGYLQNYQRTCRLRVFLPQEISLSFPCLSSLGNHTWGTLQQFGLTDNNLFFNVKGGCLFSLKLTNVHFFAIQIVDFYPDCSCFIKCYVSYGSVNEIKCQKTAFCLALLLMKHNRYLHFTRQNINCIYTNYPIQKLAYHLFSILYVASLYERSCPIS